MRLVQRALRRLNHADAILAVGHRAVQAADLRPHLFADGEPRRVVRSAVDPKARRELLDGLLERVARLRDRVEAEKCRNIVVNDHTHSNDTSM